MHADALRAYDDAGKAASSNRELEARALFKAARLLEACRTRWDDEGRDARLTEALRYNQRLWSFIEGEIADPASPLPADVRANLLGLAQYVDQRTFEVMAQPEAEKLAVLVEIDRQLALGLSLPAVPGRTAA